MIDPTDADVGRGVVYRPYPSAPPEQGVITSLNESYVFVRYGGWGGAQATRRSDLEWLASSPAPRGEETV